MQTKPTIGGPHRTMVGSASRALEEEEEIVVDPSCKEEDEEIIVDPMLETTIIITTNEVEEGDNREEEEEIKVHPVMLLDTTIMTVEKANNSCSVDAVSAVAGSNGAGGSDTGTSTAKGSRIKRNHNNNNIIPTTIVGDNKKIHTGRSRRNNSPCGGSGGGGSTVFQPKFAVGAQQQQQAVVTTTTTTATTTTATIKKDYCTIPTMVVQEDAKMRQKMQQYSSNTGGSDNNARTSTAGEGSNNNKNNSPMAAIIGDNKSHHRRRSRSNSPCGGGGSTTTKAGASTTVPTVSSRGTKHRRTTQKATTTLAAPGAVAIYPHRGGVVEEPQVPAVFHPKSAVGAQQQQQQAVGMTTQKDCSTEKRDGIGTSDPAVGGNSIFLQNSTMNNKRRTTQQATAPGAVAVYPHRCEEPQIPEGSRPISIGSNSPCGGGSTTTTTTTRAVKKFGNGSYHGPTNNRGNVRGKSPSRRDSEGPSISIVKRGDANDNISKRGLQGIGRLRISRSFNSTTGEAIIPAVTSDILTYKDLQGEESLRNARSLHSTTKTSPVDKVRNWSHHSPTRNRGLRGKSSLRRNSVSFSEGTISKVQRDDTANDSLTKQDLQGNGSLRISRSFNSTTGGTITSAVTSDILANKDLQGEESLRNARSFHHTNTKRPKISFNVVRSSGDVFHTRGGRSPVRRSLPNNGALSLSPVKKRKEQSCSPTNRGLRGKSPVRSRSPSPGTITRPFTSVSDHMSTKSIQGKSPVRRRLTLGAGRLSPVNNIGDRSDSPVNRASIGGTVTAVKTAGGASDSLTNKGLRANSPFRSMHAGLGKPTRPFTSESDHMSTKSLQKKSPVRRRLTMGAGRLSPVNNIGDWSDSPPNRASIGGTVTAVKMAGGASDSLTNKGLRGNSPVRSSSPGLGTTTRPATSVSDHITTKMPVNMIGSRSEHCLQRESNGPSGSLLVASQSENIYLTESQLPQPDLRHARGLEKNQSPNLNPQHGLVLMNSTLEGNDCLQRKEGDPYSRSQCTESDTSISSNEDEGQGQEGVAKHEDLESGLSKEQEQDAPLSLNKRGEEQLPIIVGGSPLDCDYEHDIDGRDCDDDYDIDVFSDEDGPHSLNESEGKHLPEEGSGPWQSDEEEGINDYDYLDDAGEFYDDEAPQSLRLSEAGRPAMDSIDEEDIQDDTNVPYDDDGPPSLDERGLTAFEVPMNAILPHLSNSGLAVANAIHDDSDSLMEAQEVDLQVLQNQETEKQKRKECRICGYAIIVICSITLGLSLGLRFGRNEKAPSNSLQTVDSASVPAKSAPPLENLELLYDELPDTTKESLYNRDSPQFQAWEWILNHPNITSYPEWRKKQIFALATFFYSFEGPSWPKAKLKRWMDVETSECSWIANKFETKFFYQSSIATIGPGAYTEQDWQPCNENGHIQGLAVHALVLPANATPSIPPEIVMLTSLRLLANILGETHAKHSDLIVPELMQLPNLEAINFRSNGASGRIPTELGLMTGLRHLLIGDNDLTGLIPSEIATMASLENLHLGDVEGITGTLPSELGLMTKLTALAVYRSSVTGRIPTELGPLSSLETVYLDGNRLSGTIPSQVGLLTANTWLALYDNRLMGSLPTELGLMTNAIRLRIWNNALTGSIPSELGLMTNIIDFM